MIDFERINEAVKKDVTEDSVMMAFSIDLNNVAPFMCSPFVEDWIWSENTKDLNNYIYEVLIPTYLVNSIIAFDNDDIEDKEYSFIEAISLYRENNKEKELEIKELEDMYNKYSGKEITYLEFIKMAIKLEGVLEKVSIEFKTRCYANPYETRFSSMLKTDRFDFEDLNKNY